MFINESTLNKLMNGTPLEEEEHVKVMTALVKEAQAREAKEKANKKLAEDIIQYLDECAWYGATLADIKTYLVKLSAKYNTTSEGKIRTVLYNFYKPDDNRHFTVSDRPKRIRDDFGTSQRTVYYIVGNKS